jgi:hypothetical protein
VFLSVATKRVSISWKLFDFTSIFVAADMRYSEPLSSKGLFRHNINAYPSITNIGAVISIYGDDTNIFVRSGSLINNAIGLLET